MDKIRKIVRSIKKLWPKGPKLKFIYAWYYKHASIKEKQVLFESFHGKDVSDSSLAILKEFLKTKEAKDFTIYFATNDKKRDEQFIKSLGLTGIHLVDITTFEYTKVLATSKYLINNSSFPVFFTRRDEQIYLQTWHGTPLKTLGKKMRMGIESMYNVQHNFLQANYIMFPNEFTKKAMMEDYNLENLYTGKVVMNGYPRNSIFMDKDRAEEVKRQLGNEHYTTIAYMPTWRGQSNHDISSASYNTQVNDLLQHLDDQLKDDQKLYVNFHPIVQKSVTLGNYKHIEAFPSGVDKYEFLNSVDALITDYSSVFFDFSITRKPIILYMYDYDEYMYDRGMYFDIKELPFRKIYDIDTLTDCLVNETFKEDNYADDTEYINKYIQYDSIDAGKNMVDLVFKGHTGNMPVIDYTANKKKKVTAVWAPGIRTPEALKGLAETVDKDKEIVLFEKRFFKPKLSSYLHDNYRDSFDYLFITKTLPRTYLEEVVRKKSTRLEKKLRKREWRRLFSELNVSYKIREEYYHGMVGERFFIREIPVLKAKTSLENNIFTVKFDRHNISDPGRLLIVKPNKEIVFDRVLTKEEKENGIITEDFQKLFMSGAFEEGKKYYLMVEGRKDADHKMPYYLCDTKLFEQRSKKINDLDQSALLIGEIKDHNKASLSAESDEIEASIFPTMNKDNGNLQILYGTDQDMIGKNMKGEMVSLKINKTVVSLRMKFKKQNHPVKNVILAYRSKIETIEYDFDYTVKEEGEFWIVDASIDMAAHRMEELFWDVFVVTENEAGKELRLSAYWTRKQRFILMFRGYQCNCSKDHIIFPYSTMGGKIAFTYRTKSKYDGIGTKIKEIIAVGIYAALLPYWKKKRLWLVYEKFCSMAQDNGYFFFKHCMEEEQDNKHIYYILDKDSVDWDKMKKYGKQVIPFMSIKHMLYCMVANLYIASDSKKHLYAWRTKPNMISNRIACHNILFLQHGVTALKKVDPIFGKKGTSPMNHFTTTSKFEQEIIVEHFGYTEKNAPLLGFTRWDVLEDKSKPEEKIILAMPTWRAWLEEKSAQEFKESDYYYNYMQLLKSEKLAKILKDNDVKLIFYIHPKFKDYLGEFNISGENVELIPFGKQPLNEIMMRCSMLITDYSSVCWDVYYMAKPVLFYQFDYDMYMQAHGSYVDMEHDLFGERYTEYEDLIEGIEKYVDNGFEIKKEDLDNIDYYFAYRDNDNSKRTYDYVVERGY